MAVCHTFPGILQIYFGSAYQITNSLLFDGTDNYLSRTPSVAGDNLLWTFDGFVRKCGLGAWQTIFSAGSGSGNYFAFRFTNADNIEVMYWTGAYAFRLVTTAVYRDPSSHMHINLIYDVAQATASNRIKLSVNGTQVTSFSTASYPAQGYVSCPVNTTVPHYVGTYPALADFFNGPVAEPILVDGAALTPSSFGEVDPVTLNWRPKRISGLTYGTNGCYLGTPWNSADLGNDYSGNNNDWTPTGFSASDVVTDTPTNVFATWNPLRPSSSALTVGNMTAAGAASATQHVSRSDQWYWEVTANAASVVAGLENTAATTYTASVANGTTTGFRYTHSTTTLEKTTDGTNWTTVSSAVVGVAFPYASGGSNSANFGQKTFTYTPPTGFKALCTSNLPATTGATSGSFTGNANADGPCIFTGAVPETLTIDGNAVTWGTHADKLSTGFKIRTASSPYNDAATNNWAATYNNKPTVGSNHVPANAQGNP